MTYTQIIPSTGKNKRRKTRSRAPGFATSPLVIPVLSAPQRASLIGAAMGSKSAPIRLAAGVYNNALHLRGIVYAGWGHES